MRQLQSQLSDINANIKLPKWFLIRFFCLLCSTFPVKSHKAEAARNKSQLHEHKTHKSIQLCYYIIAGWKSSQEFFQKILICGGKWRTANECCHPIWEVLMRRSPADKEVHGRVKVLVLHDSHDYQDVLQQGDDTQGQKDLIEEHQETGSKKTNDW